MKGDGKLVQLGKGVLFSLIFTLLAILVSNAAVRSTNIQFCSIDSFSDYSLTAFRASTSVKFTVSISTVRS